LGKAGQNADISTEDALLNKKAMASAIMVICGKLEKAGQNANASTEDVLLNKKSHGICRDGDDQNGQTMAKCHDDVTGHQLRWRAAGPAAGEFTL
jgi:hypothetical protein